MESEIKVDAMCQERHGLRLEIIEMERSTHKALMLFLSLSGIAGTLLFDNNTIVSVETRNAVMFALSQVEYILAVFILALIANQNIHAGYIKFLEIKINDLCGEKISLWESEYVPHFIFSYKGSSVYIYFVLSLYALLFFVLCLYFAFSIIDNFIGGLILSIEVIVLIVLTIIVHIEPYRVKNFKVKS